MPQPDGLLREWGGRYGACRVTVRGMELRPYRKEDWDAIWPFFREIVQAQETFPYDPEWTSQEAQAVWEAAEPWWPV
ncbi:hypothetical protein GCM10017783_00060 [Deinococcus piscis]|uniref:GNAT family N-acetyltransferase n=2 Tax=Deinococcus piscis TaxID=394230 RepID=A0ABQ3JZL4_9DEIO|nr:hypothetical protein GCM10017783_00060 [Deinococcus piscis]